MDLSDDVIRGCLSSSVKIATKNRDLLNSLIKDVADFEEEILIDLDKYDTVTSLRICVIGMDSITHSGKFRNRAYKYLAILENRQVLFKMDKKDTLGSQSNEPIRGKDEDSDERVYFFKRNK